MQPAQQAYENLKGYVASMGASMDASRHLSMDMANQLQAAPNASVAKAMRNIGAETAITSSLREREGYFQSVGNSSQVKVAIEATNVSRMKGMDPIYGAGVEVVTQDLGAAMKKLAEINPQLHAALVKHAKAQAQDFAALERISPSSALRQADALVFGNSKCSDLAKVVIAMEIKAINPQSPIVQKQQKM